MPASSPTFGFAVPWVVAAYLLGTFPTALVAAGRRGVDPTVSGSRNPGATNVLRTAGRRAGVVTLAGDLAKGALAAGIGWAVGGRGLGLACGVAAVAGHVLPVTRSFRGGKGVATAAGMGLVLYPLAMAVATVVFVVTTGISRMVSPGSIAAVAVMPLAAAALGAPGREVAALAACAALVVVRHRENLVRLVRGEERRLGAPGPTSAP